MPAFNAKLLHIQEVRPTLSGLVSGSDYWMHIISSMTVSGRLIFTIPVFIERNTNHYLAR